MYGYIRHTLKYSHQRSKNLKRPRKTRSQYAIAISRSEDNKIKEYLIICILISYL